MSSQRVNIQYSIDLEDLPEEVTRLVDSSTTALEVAFEHAEEISNRDDHLTVKTVEEINSLRLALSKVDYILEDVTKIVGGYLKMALAPVQEESQQAPPAQTVDNPFTSGRDAETTIGELQQKLTRFTESMNEQESAEINVD